MYYIKERHNPQIGSYYIALGKMTAKAAKKAEQGGGYGTNYMHKFRTRAEYEAEIQSLVEDGQRVN